MKKVELSKTVSKYNFEAPIFPANTSARGYLYSGLELKSLDLSQFLAPKPEDTFIVRVAGDSMIGDNIFEGDLLLVSKSEPVKNGKIVVASIDGEVTVKRFVKNANSTHLAPSNPKFNNIEINEYNNAVIQGVVKHIVKSL